jgi:hypothetical protein
MALGGFGGLPVELGGGPSSEEATYRALREPLVGQGVPADDDLELATIDGLWRASKALGLAALNSVEEAAHWQAWPSTATDELPTYEEILRILVPVGADFESRRAAVVARWTDRTAGVAQTIEDKLLALHPDFELVYPLQQFMGETIPGKYYDPLWTFDGEGSFSNPGPNARRGHALYPNHGGKHRAYAVLDLAPTGAIPEEIGRIRNRAIEMMDETLPAWNDFGVLLAVGFILDSSLLDVTGFAM